MQIYIKTRRPSILTFDIIEFNPKNIRKDKEGHFILTNATIHQKTLQIKRYAYDTCVHLISLQNEKKNLVGMQPQISPI